LTDKQAGIGNAVAFVLDTRDIAAQLFGLDAELTDATLESLTFKIS